jgi:PAS domain-containing protein
LISISPLRDAEGRLIGAIHVARDISDLKRTEMTPQSWLKKY